MVQEAECCRRRSLGCLWNVPKRLQGRVMEIVRLHIAKAPCYPSHGIIAEYDNGTELWDCDCASNDENTTLSAAAEMYPDMEVTMWDNPNHYVNREKEG